MVYGVNKILGAPISELDRDSTANPNINFANRFLLLISELVHREIHHIAGKFLISESRPARDISMVFGDICVRVTSCLDANAA